MGRVPANRAIVIWPPVGAPAFPRHQWVRQRDAGASGLPSSRPRRSTFIVVWRSARPSKCGPGLGTSSWPPATDVDLSEMATTNIEIDTDLLARLRERHPGKDDRSLIEDLARIELGFGAVRDAQKRNELSEDEAIELGVRAVHEARSASA